MPLLGLTFISSCCFAQGGPAYPAKPVRVLVGFTAGSELDVVARLVTNSMFDKLGQKFVVENRTGAGGTVAGAVAAKSPADGYTLFFNSVSHTASTALYPQLSYDPIVDFAGVSQATSAPNVLLLPPGQSAKSVKELIAFVHQKAGQINFGSAGVGSGTHIAGEMFRLGAKLNVAHVPYKGVPEVINDTITARIDYSFAPIGNVLPFVADKRVVALAVTTIARSPSLPDTPTIAETVTARLRLGPVVWPVRSLENTASHRRAAFERDGPRPGDARGQATPATRGSLAKSSTPNEFDRFVRAETEKTTRVIKEGGIKLE